MQKLLFVTLFIIFLVFPQSVLAVDVAISNFPPTITSDTFNVDVSISGASTGTNYLRVDLYKDGTSNYFGETYNGSSWYNGSEGINYFPIQIQDASASATLQARIGNPSANEYTGSGVYKLKIRRYTNSGNPASGDNQNPVDIQINYSTPSPTAAPTSTPTNAPAPIPTKTSTPVPTKSPTSKPTPTPTPTDEPEVLGESSMSGLSLETFSPTPTSTSAPLVKGKKLTLPIIFITSGVLLLGFAVLQLINAKKSAQTIKSLGSSGDLGGNNI